MTPDELEAIRRRDQQTSDIWFIDPRCFTADNARDRRALLAYIDELVARVEALEDSADRLVREARP